MKFEEMPFWSDPEFKDRFSWYRSVSSNRKPAKFRIAQQIPVDLELETADLEQLLQTLSEKRGAFDQLFEQIKGSDGGWPWEDEAPYPNLLDLIDEIANRSLQNCDLCRWHCNVDRTAPDGKKGTCKLERESRVSTFFHHGGEEWIYRGFNGSGTIFFTSCNMRCAFCQNGDISTDKDNGTPTTPEQLATMAWLLRMEGCHNINWVGGEPTIHLHTICSALRFLATEEPSITLIREVLGTKSDFIPLMPLDQKAGQYRGKFNAPILWNSNFFISEKGMNLLYPIVDIWLPDFKFGPGKCAIRLSRTPWYWETITSNLLKLKEWGEELTIRHLVMPEHVDCCTRPILEWLAEHLPDTPVNIMDQYRPDNFCEPHSEKYNPKYRELSRRPYPSEMEKAYQIADSLGLPYKAISELR